MLDRNSPTEPIAPEPTEEVRFTNLDNSWNKEGLLASHTEADQDVVKCTKTDEPLFFIRARGTRIMLASHGYCCNCEEPFEEGQLVQTDGSVRSAYPVRYIGRWCQTCSSMPEHEWNKKEEE